MAKTTIDKVADVFLSLDSMSPKKLQKLCYYAYCWYYTLQSERLFQNRFEAWVHGPVDPGLFQRFRDYGWHEIEVNKNPLELSSDLVEFIQEVFASYGDMTADELEYLTHEELPWKIARGKLPEYAPCSTKIDDQVIEEYYGSLQ